MATTRTVTGTIEELKRLNNIPSGNPVWRITVQGGAQWGVYRTAPDAAVGHVITPDMLGQRVTLTVSSLGVVDIDPKP